MMQGKIAAKAVDAGTAGVKVIIPEPLEYAELLRLTARWTEQQRYLAPRVWVWLYIPEMDINGPSLSLGYAEEGKQVVTEIAPIEAHMIYYLGKDQKKG